MIVPKEDADYKKQVAWLEQQIEKILSPANLKTNPARAKYQAAADHLAKFVSDPNTPASTFNAVAEDVTELISNKMQLTNFAAFPGLLRLLYPTACILLETIKEEGKQ